ncbi:MAG: hypothetical protein HY929_04070 [Euryarchaeota archaeon]|nr:hypothetical protein [Euryarchaeota archaeon]
MLGPLHYAFAITTIIVGTFSLILLYRSTHKLLHRAVFSRFSISLVFLLLSVISHFVREHFGLEEAFGESVVYPEYILEIGAFIAFLLAAKKTAEIAKSYKF